MPQEILRSLPGRTIESDPDAGGDEHLLFFESKGRLQYVPELLCYSYSLTYTGDVLNQDSELVSTKTRGGVFRT